MLHALLASLLAASRPAMPAHTRPALAVRASRPVCSALDQSAAIDLVGDGGVLKAISRAGNGSPPQRGAVVEVHYVGKLLDTGAVFDSSRARGKVSSFFPR